jgi:hypothetical protein
LTIICPDNTRRNLELLKYKMDTRKRMEKTRGGRCREGRGSRQG